jgi:hypothetical protein
VKPEARGEGAAFSPALLRISTNAQGEADDYVCCYMKQLYECEGVSADFREGVSARTGDPVRVFQRIATP